VFAGDANLMKSIIISILRKWYSNPLTFLLQLSIIDSAIQYHNLQSALTATIKVTPYEMS